jgi:hypothetical protein
MFRFINAAINASAKVLDESTEQTPVGFADNGVRP